uniref:Splicing factor 3a subunit 3 n=1 Tax=Gorilla gorilla gorilla TaxID=9595 RepID=A0A2I2YFX2_GORGO
METILEQQQRYHEEKERLMDVMAKEMLTKKSTLNSDHRTQAMQDRYMEEELNAISGPNEFEFHQKHPNEICVPMLVEFEELLKAQNLVEFTDEEGYGRYLDLRDCYLKYINVKASEKLDYITYLSISDQLFDIPKERKNAEYKRYLEMLLEVKPLQDQNELFGKIQAEFEKKWENVTFLDGRKRQPILTSPHSPPGRSSFRLEMWRTVEEQAQRLFSTKGKSLESLDKSLFAKNPKSKGTKRDIEKTKTLSMNTLTLREQQHLTHENAQCKQARTGEEQEEQISKSESKDEKNEIIYNPKNLPLGWDGKRIPYWLYKLHGLNINYNCEICGNYTYQGRKHHAHGMRCLGIPNTAHFANVTQIEDAVSLWAKLKLQKPDTEEYEDSSGNVVNKKTYEDLKRQGLL